ncbi:MAG TPA: SpoIID/LytB domain-containing protein [Acidobacteriota bacterium]|nr:SpoIID/LytB domain-containing protein [Acidobacteriota bacterium]
MTFRSIGCAVTGCLISVGLLTAAGCIPSRTRTGGLFAQDPTPVPVVRVRLPHADSLLTLTPGGRFILRLYRDASGDATIYSSEERLRIQFAADGITVSTGDDLLLGRGVSGLSIHTTDAGDKLTINDKPYYGTLIFGWSKDREPLVVNRLNLDTYLTGVLTPELGERSADEFEAVKAQSVASRTYALAHLGQYGRAPYDLRADVGDQVYVGASQPRDWVRRAVAATHGEVLATDGQLIDAYYHSTCGGRTDAVEDVWDAVPRPYLVSAPDDTFCQWSRYSEWTERFDLATLLANLNAYREQLPAPPVDELKEITDIRFENQTPGGRVEIMTVITPHSEWTICADQIRWALGRPSRPGSILPSGRFRLTLERDGEGRIIRAEATGSGYGHGVGMCQCGMIGRARAGHDYRSILAAYYKGAHLRRIY